MTDPAAAKAFEELAALSEARSNYNARKTDSSIIAWTLSPAWTDVRPFAGHGVRGCVIRTVWGAFDRGEDCPLARHSDRADTLSGEIP